MIGRFLLQVLILTVSFSAQAAWEAGGGAEHYQWIEHLPGYSGNPKESGTRYAIFVNWSQEAEHGALFAWRAKLYAGTVNYDTYLISSGAPISTKTDYGGATSEVLMYYRYNFGAYKLDPLGGIGMDFWRRYIRNDGGGQIEDYTVLYWRAGLRFGKSKSEPGFHGEYGLKFPLSTREDAHLNDMGYTSNPEISPKGAVSSYAEFGYRINSRFDVLAYYDSWRFNRSDNVTATDSSGVIWFIHQPESYMDSIGLKLLATF